MIIRTSYRRLSVVLNRLIHRALIVSCAALLVSCEAPEAEPTTPAESFERAVSAYQERDLERARGYFLQAETMSRDQGRVELVLQAIVYQARIADERGDVRTAIVAAQRAAAVARQIGDFRAEAEVRVIEGRSYRSAGILREADRALQDALRLSETFQEKPKVAEARLALGDLWMGSSDPGRADEHFSRALEVAQSLEDAHLSARALTGLASVFLRQGKIQESVNSVSQAAGIVDGLDDPVLKAKTRLLQGEILESQGNANAALSAYREAVNVLRRARTGRRLEAMCLFRIGLLYQGHRRSGDAKKYFSDGLEIARREGDKIAQYYLNVHLLLADIRLMTPDQQTRIAPRIVQAFSQLATQFRSILQRPGEAFVRGYAGDVLRRGNPKESLILLGQASEAERASDIVYLDPELHRPYVTALPSDLGSGPWSRTFASQLLAADQVVSAITSLELRRLRKFASGLDGVDLTLRHPKAVKSAQELRTDLVDLRLRGTELSARLGSSRMTDTLTGTLPDFAEAESGLILRGNSVFRQHPSYAVIVRVDSLALADLRRHIPRGVTMIEHIGDGQQIHILAVSRSDMLVRTVSVPESSVYARAEEYRNLMLDPMVYSGEGGESSVPGMTRFAILSTELYDILLRPVETMIDRGIIVVPNEMIGALPIHALERQETGGRLEFVVERMSVDYLPSWSSVMFPTRMTGRLRSIVAFGNPSGKNWSVDYELRDIRSFFRNADVYTGRDATWENMSRTSPDLIQVSSEFSPGLTSYGMFLVSAGEATEETRVMPFERLLELESPPVVLLTNQSGGQYSLGPQHAIMLRMNGTSDVFLNRWIADRKAAKFFSEFFFTHLSGGLAPGDAYRQALLNLIQTREHAHPRSWAQFFHFGTG